MSELSMLADEQMRAESDALYHAGMGDELSLSDREKCDEVVRLRHENAKLRELVADMWICISHGSEGWDCTGCRRDPDAVCIRGISEFAQRMRELGIEVN